MKTNELRLGNWVQVDGTPKKVVMIQTMEFADWDSGDDIVVIVESDDSYYDCVEEELIPIPITEEILSKCGFYQLPHYTVMNSFMFDLGRNRVLSIGNVNDANQCVFITQMDDGESKIDDLVCLHNYDYDGLLHLHELQNLIFDLTREKLEVKL